MKKNFSIRDGFLFELSDGILDVRGECSLSRVEIYPGSHPAAELIWDIDGSNQILRMSFTGLEDFVIKGRDKDYPFQSGVTLKVAGFSDGSGFVGELYVEPTKVMSYISFVMDDMSAFLIKADLANVRRV
jgi:hypothetical protein